MRERKPAREFARGTNGEHVSLDRTEFSASHDTSSSAMLRNMSRAMLIASLALAAAVPAAAQRSYPTAFEPSIVSRVDVKQALGWLDSNFDRQVEEWVHIAEMQGQSRHEGARGSFVRRVMEAEGLQVTVDSIGNVVGRRPGTGGGPTIVFAAHLDIVHPMGTDLKVRRKGDTLHAPGIFDNSASVANMLAVIRALNQAKLRTRGDLIFIGTAQEELGLKGMAYWLDHAPRRPDMLVAMDGGLGPINYGALGIYWTRYFFRGEGAHTVRSTGQPHPAKALAEAIRSVYELRVPEGQGGAVYNVGMLDGGKIFNGIPQEVSFTMDLRSVNPVLLDSLNREIESRVARARRCCATALAAPRPCSPVDARIRSCRRRSTSTGTSASTSARTARPQPDRPTRTSASFGGSHPSPSADRAVGTSTRSPSGRMCRARCRRRR
jgi:tripeptide aminopeptidase